MKNSKIVFPIIIAFMLTHLVNAQQLWKIPVNYHSNGKEKTVVIKEGKKIKRAQEIGYNFYYENGKLRGESRLQSNGLYLFKQYYKSGVLGAIGMSHMDLVPVKTGHWKTYHENGQLKQTVTFGKTSKEGEFKEYYEDGTIKITGRFGKVGARMGVWNFYNQSGEIEKKEDYGDGTYITVVDRTNPEDEVFDLL